MVDARLLTILGGYEDRGRQYSPDVYLTSSQIIRGANDTPIGGFARDPAQMEQMIRLIDRDVQMSLNVIKVNQQERLSEGKYADDLYGSWGYIQPPTDDEVPARLWMILPLHYVGEEPEKSTRELMAASERIILECVQRGWGRPHILKAENLWTILYKCRYIRDQEMDLLYDKVVGMISAAAGTDTVKVLSVDKTGTIPICGNLVAPRDSLFITKSMLQDYIKGLHFEDVRPDPWNGYKTERNEIHALLSEMLGSKVKDCKTHDGVIFYKISESETIYYDKVANRVGFYDCKNPSLTWKDFYESHGDGQEVEKWQKMEEQLYADFNRKRPAPDRLRDLDAEVSTDDVRKFTHDSTSLRNRDRTPKQYLKTGIHLLDNSTDGKHHGLPRKGVTILEAKTSAGKTALLTEIKAHMMLSCGYRVWEYNAELSSNDVADLLERNIVGTDRLEEIRPGMHKVSETDADIVWKELDDKYYLYDNRLGMKWQTIEESLIWHCEAHRIDCAIFDDQIMIDAGILRAHQSNDGESEQVALMRRLHMLAMHYNLAIVLVCHPRKDQGVKAVKRLVTPEDILGSTKLHALSTMCLCYHRVYGGMEDFRERCKNTPDVYLEDTDPIFDSKADAVLQIAKDRFGGGSQSYYLPLYYEPGTNRLKNSRNEHKIYEPFISKGQPLYSMDVNPFS